MEDTKDFLVELRIIQKKKKNTNQMLIDDICRSMLRDEDDNKTHNVSVTRTQSRLARLYCSSPNSELVRTRTSCELPCQTNHSRSSSAINPLESNRKYRNSKLQPFFSGTNRPSEDPETKFEKYIDRYGIKGCLAMSRRRLENNTLYQPMDIHTQTLIDKPIFHPPKNGVICKRFERALERQVEEVKILDGLYKETKKQNTIKAKLFRTKSSCKPKREYHYLPPMKTTQSNTIIKTESGSVGEISAIVRRELNNRKNRESNRWLNLSKLYSWISSGYHKIKYDFDIIQKELSHLAESNESLNLVTRYQFVDLFQRLYSIEINNRLLNLVYSSFDIYYQDVIDYRFFLSCLRCFYNPYSDIKKRLMEIFQIYDVSELNEIGYSDLLDIFHIPCISEMEKSNMAMLVDNHFSQYVSIKEPIDDKVINCPNFKKALTNSDSLTLSFQFLLEMRISDDIKKKWESNGWKPLSQSNKPNP